MVRINCSPISGNICECLEYVAFVACLTFFQKQIYGWFVRALLYFPLEVS